VRAGPDFIDEPERYGNCGAQIVELPLERFPGVNPGKLRLLADRAGLRTLATTAPAGGRGLPLLERAVLARLDYVELPLETDVETRGRFLAKSRKSAVKVVLSQRSDQPPRSAETVLRTFQKCARAGGDLALVSCDVSRADDVRALREASAAARRQGIPHGLRGSGGLSALAPLLGADLVFGDIDGRDEGLDIGLLSRISPATRLCAVIGEPAHPEAAPGALNEFFRRGGLDHACIGLRPGPDGPGALARLLAEMGFLGILVGRPFRTAMASGAPAPAGGAPSVSVVRSRAGGLAGFDTDGPVLLRALDDSGIRVHRRRALVLGTGGAARSAARALRSRGAHVAVAGRDLRKALEAAGGAGARAARLASVPKILARSTLLVNAIPSAPSGLVPEECLRPGLVVVDLDCSPGASDLLDRAAGRGAHVVGGRAVLAKNLAEALRLFTGARPSRRLVGDILDEALRRAARSKKNLAPDQNY
jgi:shikimate dehydrogenase